MLRSGGVLKARASVFFEGRKETKGCCLAALLGEPAGRGRAGLFTFRGREELPFTSRAKLAAKLPRLHDNRGGGGGSVYGLTRLAFYESSKGNNKKSSSSLEKQTVQTATLA